MDSTQRTLVYLSYGTGNHVNELRYSVLSTFQRGFGAREYRTVVYTDTPEAFADLRVDIEHVSEQRLRDWLGQTSFTHRRKLMALLDALDRFPGSVVLVDSDTWFRRNPGRVFERIGPGRSCMHIRESRLGDKEGDHPALGDLLARGPLVDTDGAPLSFPVDAEMWNSGLIGIHTADKKIVEEALNLTDQLTARDSSQWVFEQFSLGWFMRHNVVSEADDVLFHYWPRRLRAPFAAQLPSLLSQTAGLPPDEAIARIIQHRPRRTPLVALKMEMRRRLRQIGFRVPGLMSSG
jgi:hypothetical protein